MPQTAHSLRLSPESVRALLGGEWPKQGFSGWRDIEYFELTSPDTVQGYDYDNEPIGPYFEFSIKVVSEEEALEKMRNRS